MVLLSNNINKTIKVTKLTINKTLILIFLIKQQT